VEEGNHLEVVEVEEEAGQVVGEEDQIPIVGHQIPIMKIIKILTAVVMTRSDFRR
jgi:hypothetical protein